MVFYKVDVVVDSLPDKEDKEVLKEFKKETAESSDVFYRSNNEKVFIFVAEMKENSLHLGIILDEARELDFVTEYLTKINITPKTVDINESTLKTVSKLLSMADRFSFVSDDFMVLAQFGIENLSDRYGRFDFGESFLDDTLSQADISAISKELLISDSFLPELKRIYKGQARVKIEGHPVHYMVIENDRERRRTTTRAILSALYSNERVANKRYCYINFSNDSKNEISNYESLYNSSQGGAIIVRYENEELDEDSISARGQDALNSICEIAYKYRNKVLTIFCLNSGCEEIKEKILFNLKTMSLVEIKNDLIDVPKANKYLKLLCKKNNVKADKALIYGSTETNQCFSVMELDNHFELWYDNKLRTEAYPQYCNMNTSKEKAADNKPKGSAYYQLQRLIGLKEAKNMIDNAINYFKAQKLFEDRGIVSNRPSMHMIFTGNPGTAKTTVARLFAQIMKENGILSVGDLYEVGRADLVGKYLGHTAPMVKKAFARAKGSVLFIDEAYSLVDDKEGLYGDEAINAIVQEMENNRQDTIVIFAGYPDKMEGFLNKNPGLRSRIAFHISFDDYSAGELCEISKIIASDIGLTLDEGAINKLNIIFEIARQKSDFGNGRYARNIIEKSKMAQAKRIMSMDYIKLSNQDICTITAEDIETGSTNTENSKRQIGFVS